MQIAGGAGAGRSLVTAIQKGLVTTFSVCFCSGGLSFGRKSLQGTLPCEHGEGGKDPSEQRAPRSSCAGQGPRGAGGELCLWHSCCGAEGPPLPRHPAPTLGDSAASGREMWPGRFPAKGRGRRLPQPRGVSGTSGPSPRCWQGSARGCCRHSGSTPARQRPTLGVPGGALLLPPSPSCLCLSPDGSGSLQRTRALQPLDGPRLPVGVFPEWKNPSAFKIRARFSEAKSAGLALCAIGTSPSFHSCLRLETPLKNCVCVDFPPRGRQQAKHWDHKPASVCFG